MLAGAPSGEPGDGERRRGFPVESLMDADRMPGLFLRRMVPRPLILGAMALALLVDAARDAPRTEPPALSPPTASCVVSQPNVAP